MHMLRLFSATVLLASVGTSQAQYKLTDTAQTRKAIERGLPFLEKEGKAWMKEKGCVSCHHIPFLLWSHNEARARGIAVDETKLAEWTDWSWAFSKTRRAWFKLTNDGMSQDTDSVLPAEVLAKLKPLVDKPFGTEKELLAALEQVLTHRELDQYRAALVKRAARPPEPTNDGGGLDTVSQLLLGRAWNAKEVGVSDFLADMRDLMVRWQQPDGSWKAAGQLPLQDRTKAETDAVTTMWAALALATIDKPDARTDRAIKSAVDFLRTVKPGRSTESLVSALLVERKFGQAVRATGLLKELLSRQNGDGGWVWRRGGDSDAFATGQALYALSQSGLPATNGAVQRARDYLIKSQSDDGSWSIPSRAISPSTDEARLKKLAPIYRYWGSAWAVIGLTQTLPEARARPAEKPK